MFIDFDLNIRECNVCGVVCESCKKEKRQKNLRIIKILIGDHHLTQVILCKKCLTSTNSVRLRK